MSFLPPQFQFQFGAINSIKSLPKRVSANEFQFQFGAINSF